MTTFLFRMTVSGSFFNGDWCDEAMSEIIEIDNNGHPIPKAEKTAENFKVSFSLFSLSTAYQARPTVASHCLVVPISIIIFFNINSMMISIILLHELTFIIIYVYMQCINKQNLF